MRIKSAWLDAAGIARCSPVNVAEKSKVACDHSVPCVSTRNHRECSTCSSTQGFVASSLPNKDISSPSNEHFSSADGGDAVHTTQMALGTTPRASLPLPDRAESAPPLFDYPRVRSEKQGFFGFTSHMSIMTEDLTQLGITSTGLDQATSVHEKPIPYEKVASGCQVLSFLQNRPMIDRAIGLLFKSLDCIHLHCGELIVRPWLSQLWISSATGDHIRWGVIAMVANYVGSFAMVRSSSDPFFEEFDMDRKSLLDQMTEVSGFCIGFCRESGLLDDGFLYALFEYYSIIKHTKGGASYASWCVGAELNSAFRVMGLHQEIRADAQVPLFLAELQALGPSQSTGLGDCEDGAKCLKRARQKEYEKEEQDSRAQTPCNDETSSSSLCHKHRVTAMTGIPIDQDSAPVNVGELVGLRISDQLQGSREMPSFLTYNIQCTHELEWDMVLQVGGESLKVKSEQPVLVMERSVLG
ncbi:hypothetical protein N7539_008364 [Penicillium diatomitis]|uniref:Uncharacterized protein n=1 Tax=Penicillium diatomitis TaxID=2819901 RepID=A0A9W9WU39_9EURO|nr:uncharacterized protein N7539_008364 [Penicillium diatomitis]KAJ5475298.1 hypothetical protein N7539_008364 [Penicillium diatomitis]